MLLLLKLIEPHELGFHITARGFSYLRLVDGAELENTSRRAA